MKFVIVSVFTVAMPSQGVPRKENKTGEIFHESSKADLQEERFEMFPFFQYGNFVETA